jgi:hypothetical protein
MISMFKIRSHFYPIFQVYKRTHLKKSLSIFNCNMLSSLFAFVTLSLLAVAAPVTEERAANACIDVIVGPQPTPGFDIAANE